VEHGGTACDNKFCCARVCEIDPSCCDTEWDHFCVNLALDHCTCQAPASGSCYEVHMTPSCDTQPCCDTVCAIDPFCCATYWDQACVTNAENLCCPQDCVKDNFLPPGDGVVDGFDLAVVLGSWGPCPGCCADTVTFATFEPPGDNYVDGVDLAVLLGAWGDPPCQN
jgi:hypothetical protein